MAITKWFNMWTREKGWFTANDREQYKTLIRVQRAAKKMSARPPNHFGPGDSGGAMYKKALASWKTHYKEATGAEYKEQLDDAGRKDWMDMSAGVKRRRVHKRRQTRRKKRARV